jgi:CubicO group peptidase (beta-lactamase class C family)
VAVEGEVASGFEPVADAFATNFAEGLELGAALCIYHRGRVVVDIAAGEDGRGRAYRADTLQLVFSTTKGATALAAHLLAERGELDLDAPVARYWPEFAAAGKAALPVRFLLSHQAGLPVIDRQLAYEEVLAWEPVVAALAEQQPIWPPGTAHGYHALTFGWLVGEVVRRVSGASLGSFFREAIAEPLGLRFYIGLPEGLEEQVARLRLARLADPEQVDPGTMKAVTEMLRSDGLALRALTLNGALGSALGSGGPFNDPALYRAELPAANGITDARSLARMYAALAGELDGMRLVSPKTVRRAATAQVDGPDRILMLPTRFGLGFMCHAQFAPLLGPSSFGHFGAGGSLGFADPEAGIGFGYVMNLMRLGLTGDERVRRIVTALRRSLARR